jgi:predicted AAA+ superfamily ATPase
MMLRRLSELRVAALLSRFPAVALIGPRQVGKTTLARSIVDKLGDGATYLDLERPSDRVKLTDAEQYFTAHSHQLVVLDEIQRVPNLFQVLRGVIDERRRQGQRAAQFLLLGSASIDLLRQTSETLAGRIASQEMTPLLIEEVDTQTVSALDRLWVRGGFPDSFLALDDGASDEWRMAFLRTYLERDIPALGPRIPAETLRRFWTMLAHEQGTLLNAARLAAGLGISGQTVARYLDLLVDLLLVRRLSPWVANVGKRLVRSPKVYVRDSGLVHALLRLPTLDAVLGHPVAGGSWEGLVIENLIAAASPTASASFYRTAAGAEVDLVLDLGADQRWAIEIKRSFAPTVSKGFHAGCNDLKPSRRIVVYPGTATFELGNAVQAMSLRDACAALRATYESSSGS